MKIKWQNFVFYSLSRAWKRWEYVIYLTVFLVAKNEKFAVAQTTQVWGSMLYGFQSSFEQVVPRAVATDNNDNIVVLGHFAGAIRSPFTLTMTFQGEIGYHIVKYNSSGTPQWGVKPGYQIQGNNVDEDYFHDVETDASGNVYFAGGRWVSPNSSIVFGKLNGATGLGMWYHHIVGTGGNEIFSIDTDNARNLYVAGRYSGSSVDFDPGSGSYYLEPGGGSFVAVYDSNGNFVRAFGLPVAVSSIAIDPSNNILISGRFTGTIDFDLGAGTQSRTSSVFNYFIAKYTQEGDFIWVNQLVGPFAHDRPIVVTTDADGNVVTSGAIIGSNTDFDPGTGTANLTSNGGFDIFVAKYDPSGNYQFEFNIGNIEDDFGKSIATDASGNIYVTGVYRNTVDFDPGSGVTTLPPGFFAGFPQESEFVSMYNSSGTFQYVLPGSVGSQVDIDIDSHSNMLWFFTTPNINGTSMSNLQKHCNPPSFSLTSSASSICKGSSVELMASGAATYSWTGPSLSATTGSLVTATPLGSGSTLTYTVVGTNVNGCTASKSITVSVYPETISVTPQFPSSICPGWSITLTASGGASTYSWSPSTGLSTTSGATVTASPTTATTYTVSGPDPNGCTSFRTVTVPVRPSPTVSVTPLAPSKCLNVPGGVQLTASGASTYSWSPGTGLSATTGASVTANVFSTTTYTVTGTGSNGCTDSETVTVTVHNPIVSVTPSNPTICLGSSINLTASGASTYSWSPSIGLSNTSGSIVTANPPSTTNYTVSGTSSGCTSAQGITVIVNSNPSTPTISGSSIICATAPTLTSSTATSYLWSTGETSPSITAPGAGNYWVRVMNAQGCQATSNTFAVTDNRPSITISPTSILSPCSSVTDATFTASPGSSYLWYPNGQTTQSITATSAGNYYVRVTNPNGCPSSVLFSNKVIVENDLTLAITGRNTFCQGNHAELYASTNVPETYCTYLWSDGTTSAYNLTNTPGTYTVTATNLYTGCSVTSAPVTVTMLQNSNGGYITASESCYDGDAVTLTANPAGTSYSWSSSGSTNRSINTTALTNHYVTFSGAGGITRTACFDLYTCEFAIRAEAESEVMETEDPNIQYFPNPADHEVIILLQKPFESDATITVNDLSGRAAMQDDLKKGELQKIISIKDLPAGVYLLQTRLKDRLYVKRIIVIHNH